MTSSDYSWDLGSPLNAERLTGEVVPTRYALTAPQVVVNNDGQILLIDPHAPGTWDTWMFPYASLILTRDQVVTDAREPSITNITEGATFDELTRALISLRQAYQKEYVAAVRDGVNNVLSNLHGTWSGTEFYTNYSLKFSHTSNVFTAYEFNYFLNKVSSIELEVPHLWIRPEDLQNELIKSEILQDRKVSSNVVEALDPVRAHI